MNIRKRCFCLLLALMLLPAAAGLAAEDVGLADPRAMEVGVAAYQACHFIGVPECNVHLAEAVVYMSLASKSNAMEMAVNEAKEAIEKEPDAPVPLVIRNAPTRLMKNLNYGKGYRI